MPGMILPWHVDNLGNWCRNNKHLNPDIDTQMCDLGPIKRYLVAITDWHWGHVIQFQNSYFPNYKSGEVERQKYFLLSKYYKKRRGKREE